MAWLAAFYSLVKAFPEIISVVLEIKKMWDAYIDQDKRKDAMVQLTEGLKNARINKDTTQLTALINSIISGAHSGG